MENDENSVIIEIEKERGERKECELCQKDSVFFTEDDWAKFLKHKVCFRCFIEKIQ